MISPLNACYEKIAQYTLSLSPVKDQVDHNTLHFSSTRKGCCTNEGITKHSVMETINQVCQQLKA